jgi:hypothetical protein
MDGAEPELCIRLRIWMRHLFHAVASLFLEPENRALHDEQRAVPEGGAASIIQQSRLRPVTRRTTPNQIWRSSQLERIFWEEDELKNRTGTVI